jgi:hypothetical protein
MTANGLDGMAAAHELRALIREVLRDALATGYLAMPSPGGQAVRPGPSAGDADAHVVAGPDPRVLAAAPPSSIPAGILHQVGPAPGLAAADAAPVHVSASGPGAGRGRPASTADGPPGGTGTARHVRLATDEDLREFVLTVLRLADNPARRRDLLAGRLRFTLDGSPAGQTGSLGGHGSQTCRIEAGAVTERAVQAAAKAGERLVLGRRAMLTPLARDRAQALGVPIERER